MLQNKQQTKGLKASSVDVLSSHINEWRGQNPSFKIITIGYSSFVDSWHCATFSAIVLYEIEE